MQNCFQKIYLNFGGKYGLDSKFLTAAPRWAAVKIKTLCKPDTFICPFWKFSSYTHNESNIYNFSLLRKHSDNWILLYEIVLETGSYYCVFVKSTEKRFILFYIITKSMRALWLVNQLWVTVTINPGKNRASSELLYKSNRPQVSMVCKLINHLECCKNTRRIRKPLACG